MAKYTIISLILTDFVPIFFIFNLFRKLLGGHSVPKKSRVDFRGGVNPFQKSPKFIKVPTPLGGVISTLDRFPNFPAFLFWKASLTFLSIFGS